MRTLFVATVPRGPPLAAPQRLARLHLLRLRVPPRGARVLRCLPRLRRRCVHPTAARCAAPLVSLAGIDDGHHYFFNDGRYGRQAQPLMGCRHFSKKK